MTQHQAHEEEPLDLLDSRIPPKAIDEAFDIRNQKILERLSADKADKQVKDSRISKIKLKLNAEHQQKKEYHEYMHSMRKLNSRSNIIPSKTEAKDEAIRSQLLIGKLKYNERLPGVGFGTKYFGKVIGDPDQSHDSVSSNFNHHSREVPQR